MPGNDRLPLRHEPKHTVSRKTATNTAMRCRLLILRRLMLAWRCVTCVTPGPQACVLPYALAMALALVLANNPLCAGPLGVEPTLGLSAGYQSNPLFLADGRGTSETLALLLHLPVTYSGDRVSFSLQPRFRAGATHGAVAPLADYQYFDSVWDDKGVLNEFTAKAGWHRDSTLYNPFEQSALGGSTLHRQEDTGSLDWRHQLSERSDLELFASEDQVHYGATVTPTLSSFNYGQGGAKFAHDLSERWQLTLEGGVSEFELRDQSYRTEAGYAQLDLSRRLSERWSLLASIGTSSLRFRQTIEEFFLVPDDQGVLHLVLRQVDIHTRGHTGNYSLSLQREFQKWRLEVAASRALQPSGFGALATQDDVTVRLTGNRTERLTLTAAIHGSRLSDSSGRLSLGNRRYYDANVTGDWRWTEHWTLEAQLALYLQRPAPTLAMVRNAAAFLTLTREFGRTSPN